MKVSKKEEICLKKKYLYPDLIRFYLMESFDISFIDFDEYDYYDYENFLKEIPTQEDSNQKEQKKGRKTNYEKETGIFLGEKRRFHTNTDKDNVIPIIKTDFKKFLIDLLNEFLGIKRHIN